MNLKVPSEPYALAEQSKAKEEGMSRWSDRIIIPHIHYSTKQ